MFKKLTSTTDQLSRALRRPHRVDGLACVLSTVAHRSIIDDQQYTVVTLKFVSVLAAFLDLLTLPVPDDIWLRFTGDFALQHRSTSLCDPLIAESNSKLWECSTCADRFGILIVFSVVKRGRSSAFQGYLFGGNWWRDFLDFLRGGFGDGDGWGARSWDVDVGVIVFGDCQGALEDFIHVVTFFTGLGEIDIIVIFPNYYK